MGYKCFFFFSSLVHFVILYYNSTYIKKKKKKKPPRTEQRQIKEDDEEYFIDRWKQSNKKESMVKTKSYINFSSYFFLYKPFLLYSIGFTFFFFFSAPACFSNSFFPYKQFELDSTVISHDKNGGA